MCDPADSSKVCVSDASSSRKIVVDTSISSWYIIFKTEYGHDTTTRCIVDALGRTNKVSASRNGLGCWILCCCHLECNWSHLYPFYMNNDDDVSNHRINTLPVPVNILQGQMNNLEARHFNLLYRPIPVFVGAASPTMLAFQVWMFQPHVVGMKMAWPRLTLESTGSWRFHDIPKFMSVGIQVFIFGSNVSFDTPFISSYQVSKWWNNNGHFLRYSYTWLACI